MSIYVCIVDWCAWILSSRHNVRWKSFIPNLREIWSGLWDTLENPCMLLCKLGFITDQNGGESESLHGVM